MTTALYERLGGPLGIWVLADELIGAHQNNPTLRWRLQAHAEASGDLGHLRERLRQGFGAASGGPERSPATGLRDTYRAVGLTEVELDAAADDLETLLLRYGLDATTRQTLRHFVLA